MKSLKKNVAILTMCSFFLASCDFFNPGTGGGNNPPIDNPSIDPSTCIHSYSTKLVDSTCEEQGYTEHICAYCNDTYKTSYKEVLGHSYKYVAARNATFDIEGCIEHYECDRCEKVFDKSKNEVSRDEIFNHLEIFDYKNTKDPIFLVHGPLEFTFDSEAYDTLVEDYYSMCDKIHNNRTTVNEISNLIDRLNAEYENLVTAAQYAGLVADMYNREEDYEIASKVNYAYYEMYSFTYLIFAEIAESNYKTSFFSGWSNAEIQNYANSIRAQFSNSGDSVQFEMDNYINDYKAGKIDAYSALSGYVKAANRYAKQYKESNYVDFSYKYVYGREYSVDDTDSLKKYMVDYIVPFVGTISQKYYKLASQSHFDKNHILASQNAESISRDFFGSYLDSLTSYANFLGGDYEKNYKTFFESGKYYFTNTYNDNITGYINSFFNGEQYMFLGRNYQSVTTFIHEFGHYNAGITYGSLSSYDLAEVQSQGNEMLFYVYLREQGIIDDLTAEYFLTDQIYNILYTITYGYTINELEKYVYTHEDFTKQELENEWISIGNSIGLDFSSAIDYMYTVLLNYNVYYISYAVSAIAALEVYARAENDISLAKDAYISLYTLDSKNETFSRSLQNAGLYDVFSETAYQLIETAIE